VTFSHDEIEIGRIAYPGAQVYQELRDRYWQTHAFRHDARSGDILNVALIPAQAPLGRRERVNVQEHLLLAARAVQHAIMIWIASGRPIVKGAKQLVFWGQVDDALLLTQALRQVGLAPIPGLEVPLRYEIDCRMFRDAHTSPYLGLVIGVEMANVVDIPVADLMRRGLTVPGRYVCGRQESDHPYLHPNLDALGRVSTVEGTRLLLTDAEGVTEVDAATAFLEPRLENLQAAIEVFCGDQTPAVLKHLQRLRQPVVAALGQLDQVRATLARLKRRRFTIADDVTVQLGTLLTKDQALFPPLVATERPTLLHGPQGRNAGPYPDLGVRTWGPYMYTQHDRNAPLVAVICESCHRGRVEQFVRSLREGFPDELWTSQGDNPFRGGLIGKFRLSNVHLEYEECACPTASAYRAAVRHLLERLPQAPELALVQIREEFKGLRGDANPYLVTKAACMAAGVPVQAVCIEKMDAPRPRNLPT
jgi:hypothetical protein